MAARPGVGVPALDLLVDVKGAFPATEDEDGDEQAAQNAAVPADSAEAEPALGDREGAVIVAQHRYQARGRDADEDRVFHHRHADLGLRGDADAYYRDHQHGERDAGGDADICPGAAGTGGEHGEDRRPDEFDAGHGSDEVTGDHQPAGHESEVGVDRPADPLEGRAAVGVPHVQPPVGVGDDEHRDRGEDEDRPTAVGGRRGECRQSQPDRHRRGGGGHADHGVLRHSDRIGLKPCHRDRRGSWSSRSRQIRHPSPPRACFPLHAVTQTERSLASLQVPARA